MLCEAGDAHLPDPDDLKEMAKTKYLLKRSALPLIKATILTMVATPVRFSAALRLAFQHARPSVRPFAVHLIYLMEACWLSRRLKVLGLRHLHADFGTNPAEVALLVQELSRVQFSFTQQAAPLQPLGDSCNITPEQRHLNIPV